MTRLAGFLALTTLLAPAVALAESDLASVRAPHPPHCMAADQWKEPLRSSPINLMDGDPTSAWVLCPAAAREPDYAAIFTFVAGVPIDRIKLRIPPDARGRVSRVEVHFHDTSLSDQFPIHFRELSFDADDTEIDLALTGRLKWNPNLVSDIGFGERRRKRRLDADRVPMPLTIDAISLVLRDVDVSAGPVALAELTLFHDNLPVRFRNVDVARAAHARFLGAGLEHVLKGTYLVGEARTLQFNPRGVLLSIPAEAWTSGAFSADRSSAREIGRWRVASGRLEVATTGAFKPIEYAIDGAPREVHLGSKPLTGKYSVVTAPPGTETETETRAPGLKAQAKPASKGDEPPLVGEDEGTTAIPIP